MGSLPTNVAEMLSIIFSDPNIDAAAIDRNEALWFDGLETAAFNELCRRNCTINPGKRQDLPDLDSIESFLNDYPMFEAFGWVCLQSEEGNPIVYITGVEYADTAINKPVYSRTDVDIEAYRKLKHEFYEKFSDALRLEIAPELMLADYAWEPEKPLEAVETRWIDGKGK